MAMNEDDIKRSIVLGMDWSAQEHAAYYNAFSWLRQAANGEVPHGDVYKPTTENPMNPTIHTLRDIAGKETLRAMSLPDSASREAAITRATHLHKAAEAMEEIDFAGVDMMPIGDGNE